MIELGQISLVLVFVLAIYAGFMSYLGARNRMGQFLVSSRRAIYSSFVLLSLAIGFLLYGLITKNYELRYVAENVNNSLSTFYSASAVWAGQAGSLLFWVWLLSLFSSIVIYQNRKRNMLMMPYVIVTFASILVFFMFLLVFITSPFERLNMPVPEGLGLNPLLQNPGMLFHPPTLYLGYVGFTVPFAFAIAALITRKLDSEWIILTRRWTLFAWMFLGIGILVGAEWAYVELGWGGFWGWDPVENASFLPWLTGTAFLHSVMIQERRGMLKIWNVSLIIITFILTIFGTFVTRSGIIASVHSFGQSKLGFIFLIFLFISISIALYLLITRRKELASRYHFDSFLSRESSFLFNNLILVGAAFSILWGTLFPILSEAVRGTKITVGPPFFNTINLPIGIVLILLTGIGPLIAWRKATLNNLIRNFRYPVLTFFIVLIVLRLMGITKIYPLIALGLIGFVLSGIFTEFYRGIKARRRVTTNVVAALFNLIARYRRRYGGYIVHLGIMLIFVGVVGTAFDVESEQVLKKGESLQIKNYKLTFLGLDKFNTGNSQATTATFQVLKDGKNIGILTPSKHYHPLQDQVMTEVAIRSNFKEDLYLILGGVEKDGSVYIKAKVNPLVAWLWWGGYILVAGTLIAMWPTKNTRRSGKRREKSEKEIPVASPVEIS